MGADGAPFLVLPRFAVAHAAEAGLLGAIDNRLPTGQDRAFVWRPAIVLTPNQIRVRDHFMQCVYTPAKVAAGTASAIAVVRAGHGKTYIAGSLIAAIGKKTMYVVPSRFLLEQTVADLRRMLDCTIGVWRGGAKTEGDIIVATSKSVATYTGWASLGTIVYDEIHDYPTEKTSTIFRLAQAARVFGITATPDERLDGFDVVSSWYCGPLVWAERLAGWDPNGVVFNMRVTRIMYRGPPEYTEQLRSAATGNVDVGQMITQMLADETRGRIITDGACAFAMAGKFAFIFTERRAHCETLLSAVLAGVRRARVASVSGVIGVSAMSALVADYCGDDESLVIVLYGGASDAVQLAAKTTARIIITTYAFSGKGVSIPRMDALFMATPRRNKMRQIIPRILRLGGDAASRREVYDLVDAGVSMKSQYGTRKTVYVEMRAEIRRLDISWDSYDPVVLALES
jgi:superfamily II DNA or RNA helicase